MPFIHTYHRVRRVSSVRCVSHACNLGVHGGPLELANLYKVGRVQNAWDESLAIYVGLSSEDWPFQSRSSTFRGKIIAFGDRINI
jgi:hypothetical protein